MSACQGVKYPYVRVSMSVCQGVQHPYVRVCSVCMLGAQFPYLGGSGGACVRCPYVRGPSVCMSGCPGDSLWVKGHWPYVRVSTSVCQGVQSSYVRVSRVRMSGCSESVCPYVQSPYVMGSVSVCQGVKFLNMLGYLGGVRVLGGQCPCVRGPSQYVRVSRVPVEERTVSACQGVKNPFVRKSSVCLSEDPVSVVRGGFQCPSMR